MRNRRHAKRVWAIAANLTLSLAMLGAFLNVGLWFVGDVSIRYFWVFAVMAFIAGAIEALVNGSE